MTFDVGEAAVRRAEATGDWSGIAFGGETVMDLVDTARAVVRAAEKARERGQPLPTGVRISIGLLGAVLAPWDAPGE